MIFVILKTETGDKMAGKKLSKEDMAIVLDCICIYDKRNPDYARLYAEDDIKKPDDCYCDNCFRGLHKLAGITLKLIGV